jgi:hypothetical protein
MSDQLHEPAALSTAPPPPPSQQRSVPQPIGWEQWETARASGLVKTLWTQEESRLYQKSNTDNSIVQSVVWSLCGTSYPSSQKLQMKNKNMHFIMFSASDFTLEILTKVP